MSLLNQTQKHTWSKKPTFKSAWNIFYYNQGIMKMLTTNLDKINSNSKMSWKFGYENHPCNNRISKMRRKETQNNPISLGVSMTSLNLRFFSHDLCTQCCIRLINLISFFTNYKSYQNTWNSLKTQCKQKTNHFNVNKKLTENISMVMFSFESLNIDWNDVEIEWQRTTSINIDFQWYSHGNLMSYHLLNRMNELQKPSVSTSMVTSSPTSSSSTITHRTNKVSSLVHNRRPQSMLSARALMFDEPSSSSASYDRDLLKLSTSPKQQQHCQVNIFINWFQNQFRT